MSTIDKTYIDGPCGSKTVAGLCFIYDVKKWTKTRVKDREQGTQIQTEKKE